MTALIEKAIAEISKLPPERQDEVASWVLSELDSENRWAATLANSAQQLEGMADEALAEHRAGRTREFDPDKL